MTRSDWLLLATPTDLYGELTMVRTDRSLYLLGCAYLRRVWDLMINKWMRGAVEATEAFIDGRAAVAVTMHHWAIAEFHSLAGVWCATSNCWDACHDFTARELRGLEPEEYAFEQFLLPDAARLIHDPAWLPARAAFLALRYVQRAQWGDGIHPKVIEERDAQRELFRCLCSGPRGYDRLAAWRPLDPDARELLRAIAREEQPERAMLLALADALEEEGGAQVVLDHLRDPGPHFRGCWAVEVLTGRAGRTPRVDRATIETYRKSWW